MTKTAKLTEADLRQFTGSENWYRHGRMDVLPLGKPCLEARAERHDQHSQGG
jgi:hypothetical protein